VPCSVLEKTASRCKEDRILEAFDVVMAARALSVHQSVKKTPFLLEMKDWNPSSKRNKDDGLDAVAGALALEPIRVQRISNSSVRQWFSGAEVYKADTDFQIN